MFALGLFALPIANCLAACMSLTISIVRQRCQILTVHRLHTPRQSHRPQHPASMKREDSLDHFVAQTA